MKKLLLTLVQIIFLTSITISQSLQTEWINKYNGPGNNEDRANAIAVDSSGNIYVTGESYGLGTQYDFTTIKYNSVGETLWVRRFAPAGIGWDIPKAITIDHQQNIIVTGYSWGTSTVSNHDYTTIKYNPLGEALWIAIYNGIGNEYDYAYDVAVDNEDNIVVTGTSDTYPVSGVSDFDYVTIKYNSSGDMLWITNYNGFTGSDIAYDLTIDESGNIYVTGESQGILNTWYDFDYATIKYSPDGDTLWEQRYNGPGNRGDAASAVITDSKGNVYVTGKSHADSNYILGYDYATIKYDMRGSTQWIARYNGTGDGDDEATAIVLDDEGNVYVTGKSDGVFPSNSDILTIKYNQYGDTLWVRRYNGPGNGADAANCISIDKSGNIYVSGYSYYSATYKDYILIKYNSDGDQIYVAHFEGSGGHDDAITSMVLDKNDNIYVTGYYFNSGTDYDFTTIKYSQSASGIDENNLTTPSYYFLEQNYPNPFNPSTVINFAIPQSGFVTLKVHDVLGKEVATLVNEVKYKGYHSVTFDAGSLTSGVYIYQIQAGSFTSSKKMILMK